MSVECTTYIAQSYYDSIVALGGVPASSDLKSSTCLALLIAQFNSLVVAGSGGSAGWVTESANFWAEGANELTGTLANGLFPSGSPAGTISDEATPDGTMFRFVCGGAGNKAVGGNSRSAVGLKMASAGTILHSGYISGQEGAVNTYFWNAQINGVFTGSGASRKVNFTARMSASDQNDFTELMDIQAAAQTGYQLDVDETDSFEIVGDIVEAVTFDLMYATLEYKLPS